METLVVSVVSIFAVGWIVSVFSKRIVGWIILIFMGMYLSHKIFEFIF